MTTTDTARTQRVSDEELDAIERVLPRLIATGRLLDIEALEKMVRGLERFDTVEPILDPTSWMQHHEMVDRSLAAARIVLTFRRAIAELDRKNGR